MMMFRFVVVMIGEGGDYGDERQNDDKADQLLRSSLLVIRSRMWSWIVTICLDLDYGSLIAPVILI